MGNVFAASVTGCNECCRTQLAKGVTNWICAWCERNKYCKIINAYQNLANCVSGWCRAEPRGAATDEANDELLEEESEEEERLRCRPTQPSAFRLSLPPIAAAAKADVCIAPASDLTEELIEEDTEKVEIRRTRASAECTSFFAYLDDPVGGLRWAEEVSVVREEDSDLSSSAINGSEGFIFIFMHFILPSQSTFNFLFCCVDII